MKKIFKNVRINAKWALTRPPPYAIIYDCTSVVQVRQNPPTGREKPPKIRGPLGKGRYALLRGWQQ